MVFYVTMVIFLVIFLMNKFIGIIIPSYFWFIQMPINVTSFGMNHILVFHGILS